jgi:PncC family amidohydrolase
MPNVISPDSFRLIHTELATRILILMQERRWTISSAESCTGGLFMGALTEISGSSAIVSGGVICYSNEIKEEWVGVSPETLKQYGAVSEQTGRELAQGIRDRMKSTLGIGITGIAGPGGGSPEKPVGLVYIGLATPSGVEVQRCLFDQDRFGNRGLSVEAAMKMVLEYCKTHHE